MSGKLYKKNHTIGYYECDTTGRISMPMLVNNLLRVSGEQSRELGVDDAFVDKLGLAWIILQYEMHIKRLPRAEEKIVISTQALSYNKLFCYRQFKVEDAGGEEIVSVNSTFALMDTEKRKMARVPEEVIAPYESEFSKHLVRTPKPEKIDVTEAASKEYRVRYLDIDGNKHVNNSKYFEWALDVLGYDFLATHIPVYLNVKFEKEVHYGELIQSEFNVTEQDDGNTISAHRITTAGKTNCELSAVWEKDS